MSGVWGVGVVLVVVWGRGVLRMVLEIGRSRSGEKGLY